MSDDYTPTPAMLAKRALVVLEQLREPDKPPFLRLDELYRELRDLMAQYDDSGEYVIEDVLKRAAGAVETLMRHEVSDILKRIVEGRPAVDITESNIAIRE